MVETPEITYISTYRCPRCNAALEARSGASHTWVRCPRCGRASLPPEHGCRPRTERPPLGDDVLVIGPAPEFSHPGSGSGLGNDLDPDSRLAAQRPDHHTGSVRRIALAVGILVSVTLLAMAFLDQNMINVAIFGLSTIVLFLVLFYTARRS